MRNIIVTGLIYGSAFILIAALFPFAVIALPLMALWVFCLNTEPNPRREPGVPHQTVQRRGPLK